MGLDMYAYAIKAEELKDSAQQTDLETSNDAPEEIAYWRKHGALHNWFNELYNSKGGTDPDFNTSDVRVELEDLDQLEMQVTMNQLVWVGGFFFGEDASEEYKSDDLAFIAKAREEINAGNVVYYTSWW